jgi:hypothetical protein
LSNKHGVILHCVGQLLWLFLSWLHLWLVVNTRMVKSSRGGMELWWKNFWGGENEHEYKWEGAQVSKRRQVRKKNFFHSYCDNMTFGKKKETMVNPIIFFSSKFIHRQWKKRFLKLKKTPFHFTKNELVLRDVWIWGEPYFGGGMHKELGKEHNSWDHEDMCSMVLCMAHNDNCQLPAIHKVVSP